MKTETGKTVMTELRLQERADELAGFMYKLSDCDDDVTWLPSDKFHEVALNILQSLPAAHQAAEQDRWIPVSSGVLPEVGEYVLVFNTEGATLVARRFSNDWCALFSDGEKLMKELAPTHWQPLPPPPHRT